MLGVLKQGSEIRAIIEKTKSGLCSEPGDYDAIEKNILWFIENADNGELIQMGINGRENIVKNLSRSVSVKKYAEEILKL